MRRLERALELGFATVLLGVLLVVAGALLAAMQAAPHLTVGGCVFVGPLPICFGYGEEPLLVVLVSVVIGVVMLAALLVLLWNAKSEHPLQATLS